MGPYASPVANVISCVVPPGTAEAETIWNVAMEMSATFLTYHVLKYEEGGSVMTQLVVNLIVYTLPAGTYSCRVRMYAGVLLST